MSRGKETWPEGLRDRKPEIKSLRTILTKTNIYVT